MDAKIIAKKQVKNTTEKGIQAKNSEQRGKTVLTDLEKESLKIRWLAVGTCPQCGKELIRDAECDVAVCRCASAVKVNLTLAAILPPKLEKFFENLAKQIGCTVDDVFNKCFEVGLDNVEKRLKKGLLNLVKK